MEAEGRTIPDRRRLGFVGIAAVALAISEKGELLAYPEIELIGIPAKNAAGENMSEIAYEAAISAIDSMPRPRRRDPDAVAETLRRAVRAAIGGAWGKKPICHVHVLTI